MSTESTPVAPIGTAVAVSHTLNTLAEQVEFARMVTAQPERGAGSSILPEVYRNNPANVLIAVGLGSSMGLSPAESLYRIAVIKGKPTAGAELIASNVRKSGHRLRVRGDETTCTATIIRADDKDFEFSVTRDLAWAKSMGLASNDNYKKQAGTMLQWRAITAVARQACPEALYGVVYSSDEMFDMDSPPPQSSQRSRPTHVQAAPAPSPAPEGDVVDAEVVTDDEPPAAQPTGDAKVTPEQRKAMYETLVSAGMGDPEAALAFISDKLDRQVVSTGDVTGVESLFIVAEVQAILEEPFDATEPPVGDAA